MNTDHEDRLHHIILLVDRFQGLPWTYMSRPLYGLHNPLKLPCQPYGIRSLNFNFNFIWFDVLGTSCAIDCLVLHAMQPLRRCSHHSLLQCIRPSLTARLSATCRPRMIPAYHGLALRANNNNATTATLRSDPSRCWDFDKPRSIPS